MKATIRLKANLTIIYACKNVRKNRKTKTIQASPKWGKRGVGAFIPLAFYCPVTMI